MNRISVVGCAAVLVVASGAFAQNAAPSNPSSAGPQATTRPKSQSHQQAQSPPQSQSQPQTRSPGSQTHSSAKAEPSSTETQPSAKYPHPSGQDSQPDRSSGKTKMAAASSGQEERSGEDQRSGEERKPTGRSKQVDEVAKRKAYTGSGGAKPDSSTVCSTARPTTNGGVDCGTTGNSATLGHIVTKPH